MKNSLLLVACILLSSCAFAQGFEVASLQEFYTGMIGETIKAPIRFRNTSDKAMTLVIRKVNSEMGGTQRNFYCLDNNCLDHRGEDYFLKLEPGQVVSNFQVALEAGLVSGESSFKFLAFNKANPGSTVEFELNFEIEEKADKQSIYSSRFITLHDVYPNPVIDHAVVDYRITNDQIKAKILVHNILGNVVGEYSLPAFENLIRVKTDDLSAGIYFYTLYVDNEGVMTRKLIVRK